MRALDGLREVSSFLKECGIEDSQKEAELIVSDFIGTGKVGLYRDNPPLSADQEKDISRILRRRQGREPLQYIVGFVDFYGLKIKVGPGVLIPRPETELIVEEAIKLVDSLQSKVLGKGLEGIRQRTSDKGLKILDLCTGSGCLALSLAKEIRNSDVLGTDISDAAIRYASINAKINGIANVTFKKGDLYEPVYGSKFDLIVSNPPYIEGSEITNLSPEIRTWEPVVALDGGEDGLRFYRELLPRSLDYLTDNGSLLVELGQGQAASVVKIAEGAGLKTVSLVKDYAGIERVMHLKPS